MTAERQELWTKLHAAFDERRDPLLDPALVAALAASPAAAAELAVLQRRLEMLPAGLESSDCRGSHVAVAAALLASTAVAAWLWLGPTAEPPVVVYELRIEAGAPLACSSSKMRVQSVQRVVAGPRNLDDARIDLVHERRSWK